MFGMAASEQQAIATFDGSGGILTPGSSLGVVNASQALTVVSGTLTPHGHHTGNNTKILSGMTSGAYTLVSSGGAAHNDHDISSLSITPNMYRVALRAFQLINRAKIKNLCGLWATPGAIPPRWSMVAGWNGRYLEFASSAVGGLTGTGLISVDGTSGTSVHGHGPSGSSGTVLVGSPYHSSLAHSHPVAASQAFDPARYFVKLIKFEG